MRRNEEFAANCVYTVSQAKGTFIPAGISGVVEQLQDGSVLNPLVPTKKGPTKTLKWRRRYMDVWGHTTD
jgi:hypothetical protein